MCHLLAAMLEVEDEPDAKRAQIEVYKICLSVCLCVTYGHLNQKQNFLLDLT